MADTKAPHSINALAKSGRWDELDVAWGAAVESGDPPVKEMFSALELAVKAKRGPWAEASAWAWLEQTRGTASPQAALTLARELLVRLEDGGEIRGEVLELYRKTHGDVADLEGWIQRSGLAGKASVRRALRYLDVGLHLKVGAFLVNRTEDEAAEVSDYDVAGDSVTLRTRRGVAATTINGVIEDYKPAAADDFHILAQLHPERIQQLTTEEPLKLVIGILRGRIDRRIDRDALKGMLSPRYVPVDKWSDWWTRLREAVKKSPHVAIEGRSPMLLIYHEAGRSLEQESQDAIDKARNPREYLSIVEGYLHECKSRKAAPDTAFLAGVQKWLDGRIQRLARPDPDQAFAIALVIERLAAEGLPLPDDVHGIAIKMMAESKHPVDLILSAPDLTMWPLALACAKQALPQRWPEVFAALLPRASASQCESIARQIEEAGHGATHMQAVVDAILNNPAEYTDAYMWLWNGPALQTPLKFLPAMDMLNRILMLVGPARHAGKGTAGITSLRSSVRTGISARNYTVFRKCLAGQDQSMGAAIRRQIERAEGLGPVAQEAMLDIIRESFPTLWTKARIEPWDDPAVLWVTTDGRRRKEAEVHELVNVKMRENAIAIGKAAEHGDLSENSEYKFALEERDLLRARLAQLNIEISIAKVIEPADMPTEHVGVGHRVRVRCETDGAERTLTLLGPWETNTAAGIYSYQAPIARRLLGRRPGAIVQLPFGEQNEERDYRIESFESAV